MDEIDKVREYEEENYQRAKRRIGDSVSIVQDLVDLYKLLGEFIEKSSLALNDEIVCATDSLLACRYQLSMGALSLLRGHLTDSNLFTRKAIEFCGFAARIKNHPHLGMVWLKAGDSDESYKEYLNKFRPKSLFPNTHPLLTELHIRYDQCSKQSHPSVYSICRHIEVNQKDDKISIRFNYFELKQGDTSEPIRTFLWLVDTHFGIIRVFEEVLSEIINPDRVKWDLINFIHFSSPNSLLRLVLQLSIHTPYLFSSQSPLRCSLASC